MPTPTTLGALALDRARTGGHRPFLTFCDLETGERTELGHATFANWVAKAANLFAEDLALVPGSSVAVRVGGHWAGAVTAVAAWRAGLVLRLTDREPAAAAVVRQDLEAPAADEIFVVGRGLAGRLTEPAGFGEPYTDEVLGQADDFTDPPIDPEAAALDAGNGAPASHRRVLADASRLAGELGLAAGDRLLTARPVDSAGGLVALVAALVADAGIVLAPGADGEAAGRIAAVERCSHTLPDSGFPSSWH